MARPFPYTYISCPCSETPDPDVSNKRASGLFHVPEAGEEEEEKTFNPRSPRANFSLFPPEQLLYCEDCHQIKCPRCITEEIVCWYCPNCLFETPSSMVRSEGNRCARNCFNCPICTAPLAVTTLENTSGGSATQQGPWVLACAYCMWTTLDIGIKFDKPTNIRTQLAKMTDSSGGRKTSKAFSDMKSPLSSFSSVSDQLPPLDDKENERGQSTEEQQPALDHDARFAALKSFYRTQIAETSTSPSDPLGTDFGAGFASPSALSRIMSLYSSTLGGIYAAGKKPKSKPPVMREALTASEGLKIASPDAEGAIIERMSSPDCGWDGLASIEQRAFQSPDARFVEDLRPLPVLLRTKRSKRCKACKHILVKPEFKPQSTRFRIRLIALSYIPLPTLRPLAFSPQPGQPSGSLPVPNLDALLPQKPVQYLLTLKNHMFDPVRVTLATPSRTPGRIASRVTILCPQFEIGANSDVWDEALQGGSGSTTADRSSRSGGVPGYEKVAEAGKVWDKGRNWTTIVLEVVPGNLPGHKKKRKEGDKNDDNNDDNHTNDGYDEDDDDDDDDDSDKDDGENADKDKELREDEDVLEIPVFVRLEWDSENQMEQPVAKGQKPEMVKRELAYWMVLGVGRIRPGPGSASASAS